MQSVCAHADVPSCLAVSWLPAELREPWGYDGVVVSSHLWSLTTPRTKVISQAVGSLDATVTVWAVAAGGVVTSRLHVLNSHDDAVSCVAVSCALDLVVSGRSACNAARVVAADETTAQRRWHHRIAHSARRGVCPIACSK